MSQALSWLRFVTELLPVVRELLRTLFERHRGDPEAAKLELRRIRDHGAKLDAFELDAKARLEAIKKREAGS